MTSRSERLRRKLRKLSEIAELYSYDASTLRREAINGKLGAQKKYGVWLISIAVFEDWLNRPERRKKRS